MSADGTPYRGESPCQLIDVVTTDEFAHVVTRLKNQTERYGASRLTERIGGDRFFCTAADAADWCVGAPTERLSGEGSTA